MRSRVTSLLMAACVTAVVAQPAQGQIGGFLKKKAKEAAQAPVQQQQAQQQADEAAARALSAPDIVPITEESTARFARALDVEIRLRGEFRAMLASMKPREEYEECKGEASMSPEAQQIALGMANISDKGTPAEMQKAMLKISRDIEALIVKKCGGDPGGWSDGKRAERLREIEAEASDAFAPSGGAGAGDEPAGDGLHGPSWRPTDEAQADAHPYRRKYAIAKERWIPFCAAEATKAEGKYTRVKGEGAQYVYTVEEAQVLSQHCPDVMAKLNKVTAPVQTAR
jgi:hypothetical protein